MTKFLVTGGAGFIGSHLVRRMVQDGHEVRVLDNLSTGSQSKIADVLEHIEFHKGDLRSSDDCRRACSGMEVIFHQAALPSVPRSVAEPAAFHASNIEGTFQLLLAARDAGCQRVIYAGSSSAYGDQPESPKREGMLPEPLSPYALHKLTGEYYATVFYRSYGLETITLRYFNVFGPHQDPESQYAAVIPAFVTRMLRDEAPVVYGDGEQTRDLTYIDNVVEANLLAAAAKATHGEVVNVACGQEVSINEIIRVLNRLLEKNLAPRYESPRPGDVLHSVADIRLAERILSYRPQVLFEEGLRRSVEWFRTHGDLPDQAAKM